MYNVVVIFLLVLITLAAINCTNYLKRIADKIDPPPQQYVHEMDEDRRVWV